MKTDDWREEISQPGKFQGILATGEHCGEAIWITPDGTKLARYPQNGYFTPQQAADYITKHRAE